MKKVLILAALVSAVSGCTKQDTEWKESSNLVLSGQVVFNENETAASVTKASDQLPANTEVGVYVRPTAAAGSTPISLNDSKIKQWQNLPFRCGANGNIALQGSTGVVLTSGVKYDIFAYAPRVNSVTNANRIPVTHGTDLLWGTKTVTATPGSTRADLQFRHMGAQIGFKLKGKDGQGLDLTNADFVAKGFYKTGELDLETGKVKGVDATGQLTDKTGAKTIILVTGDEMTVNVTVSNIPDQPNPFVGSYKLTLKPGKSYLYNITVNADAVETPITFDAEVTDWEDIEGGEIIIK